MRLRSWGRNTHNVAAPGAPDTELIRKAKLVVPFDGAVLRDLLLHETYGSTYNLTTGRGPNANGVEQSL
jgi:hypothetical protein